MLRYALLELLSHRSLSGYDLAKQFGASLVFFWHATHTQIYRTLKRMEAEGWVASRREVQDGRPNRRVYSITKDGREALVDWLRTPPPMQQPKDEMLLKVFGFGLIPPHEAIDQLERRLAMHEERVAVFRSVEAGLRERWGSLQEIPFDRDHLFCRYLTLYQAIAAEEMHIRWFRWAVEQMRLRESARKEGTEEGTAEGADEAGEGTLAVSASTAESPPPGRPQPGRVG